MWKSYWRSGSQRLNANVPLTGDLYRQYTLKSRGCPVGALGRNHSSHYVEQGLLAGEPEMIRSEMSADLLPTSEKTSSRRRSFVSPNRFPRLCFTKPEVHARLSSCLTKLTYTYLMAPVTMERVKSLTLVTYLAAMPTSQVYNTAVLRARTASKAMHAMTHQVSPRRYFFVSKIGHTDQNGQAE